MDAQKIDDSRLETYGMIIVSFQVDNKDKNSCFIEKTFFLTNISMDVAFRIFSNTLSNVKINFNNQKLK